MDKVRFDRKLSQIFQRGDGNWLDRVFFKQTYNLKLSDTTLNFKYVLLCYNENKSNTIIISCVYFLVKYGFQPVNAGK